jgi:hypothetical protein
LIKALDQDVKEDGVGIEGAALFVKKSEKVGPPLLTNEVSAA